MTRVFVSPRTFKAAATPVATAAALPNSECIQATCHDVSGYGVEKTSRHPVALTTMSCRSVAASRGVEDVAGAERLAAPLAGPVARRERVRAHAVGLHRAQLRVDEAVADGETAHLVELDRLLGHTALPRRSAPPTARTSRSTRSTLGAVRGSSRHPGELPVDDPPVEIEEAHRAELAADRLAEDPAQRRPR